jgi:hypothetical protein
MMTTVYVMDVLAEERRRARACHGQRRVIRRRALSTRRNFLATHIRHRPRFHALAHDQRALMLGMIVAPLGGPLVAGIGPPADRGLRALAALVPAVALASVVGPAHHEPTATVTAGQREDIELVHPSRMVENLTAISGPMTVPAGTGSSIHRWYFEGSGLATWALTLFHLVRSIGAPTRTSPLSLAGWVPGPR